MTDYGAKKFDVYFGTDPDDDNGLIKCGHQISVKIDPQAQQNSQDTSDGSIQMVNRMNESVDVTFEGLDFAQNEEEFLALQQMIEINKIVPIGIIVSQNRFKNGKEYIKRQVFYDGTVVPSESWSPGDDWQRSLPVKFSKQDPSKIIML